MNNECYLKDGLKQIGLDINDIKTREFMVYMSLIKKWGKKINLTTILDDKEIVLKHFIDSLTVAKLVNQNSKVLDIGSGAGFPGIPLVIFDKTLNMTLIESVEKKTVFLNEVKRILELPQLKIVCTRAEKARDEISSDFDCVVFRAVGKIDYLLSLSRPYLKKEGKVIIMKSSNFNEELRELNNNNFDLKELEEFNLPFSGDRRSILTFSLEQG